MSLFVFIKQRVSIADVVSERISLKPAGTYLKGSCPFHHEKTASFTVSPERGIYYCFGCQETGDVISFTAKMENIGQFEAAQLLIEQHKLSVPEELLRSKGNAQSQEEKKSFFAVCQFVAQWAHQQLKHSPEAHAYVSSRGISDVVRDRYLIGYMPSGVAALKMLATAASKEGILVQDLIRAGILFESRSSLRSPFEQRILFPITDTLGRWCGFGGRVFVQGDTRAKYYNSKESEFFLKSQLLFGYSLAKSAIKERKEVYLVEGYTDCVAMHQAGIENVVATLGTACTLDHLTFLARNTHVLKVVFDGDAAGIKAMLKLAQLCWQVNLEVEVVTLDDGHDPASYLSAHGSLDPALEKAQDIFSFYVSVVSRDFTHKRLAEQLEVASALVTMVGNIDDVVKRELLLQRISKALNLSVDVLRVHLATLSKKQHEKKTHTFNPSADKQERTDSDIAALETHIVAASMHSLIRGDVCVVPEDLRGYFSPVVRAVLAHISQDARHESGQAHFDAVLDVLSDDDRSWVTAACVQYDAAPTPSEWQHLIARLLQRKWKDVVKDLKGQIAQATQEGKKERVEELLRRFAQLKQTIQNKGLI